MEAEFQRRVSWAELCLHADQREADGAVRERELGVAVQIFEGKLVFGALLGVSDAFVGGLLASEL